ncbi:hypothetical protein B9Z19DRAFT_1137919 [Tuber borchii]|uniref:Uncharacterized protein n=1 Tax=Tuber borchii TaxID=42251 RepID=A0A2T6ZA24_TUBBO|nr:hypothetical protein B9Z19DRAFT_1137919 [Tuber borchii]
MGKPSCPFRCHPRIVRVHRYNKHLRQCSSRALQTKLFASPENSRKPAVTHGEYVNGIRSQKVASMYSNPDYALGEFNAIRPSAWRPEAKVNLLSISRELAYRSKMAKRFSQFAAASASDGSVDRALRKLSFACDAAEKVLSAVNRTKKISGKRLWEFLRNYLSKYEKANAEP